MAPLFSGYSFDNGGSGKAATHPVQTIDWFAANGYGLYDMAGNVLEWCWDWYGSYSSGSQTDPRGPTSGSIFRVHRGGSWRWAAITCRTAARNNISALTESNNDVGFRSVLPPGQ